LDFDDDLQALETAILETDTRIKKLEDHKESLSKQLNKSENTAETLRRLEKNLDDLYQKRAFLIKEKSSKFNLKVTESYREDMIKQKEEHEKWKQEQGDSDLLFNEKDR